MTTDARFKFHRSKAPIFFVTTIASLATSGIASAAVVDYDGDHKSDMALYRPSNGFWYRLESSFGGIDQGFSDDPANDVPVSGDFDGDGLADLATWRPATGVWTILQSKSLTTRTVQWGVAGDIPAPGDYDGDGKTDFIVWRPSNGVWYSINSSDGVGRGFGPFGASGDIPVAGDYDGDGLADYAVYRPSTGTWFVNPSRTGAIYSVTSGQPGDIPVPADYDGDGKLDVTVWRPSTGVWLMSLSSGGLVNQQWGTAGDIPVPRDMDGDGRAEFVVWRPSAGTWFWTSQTVTGSMQFGLAGDVPVAIDGMPARHRSFTAPGDANDLANLGVASWGLETDTDTGHLDLNGFDSGGNKVGTVSIDMGSSATATTFGLPATVNMNISGQSAKMVINSMTGNCRPDFDVAQVCDVTVQGTIDNQQFTVSFNGNSNGDIEGNAIHVSEAPIGKRIHLAVNAATIAKLLPSLLNSFCLSCVGKFIAGVTKVASKWVEAGTVKVLLKAGQLLAGKSKAACVFQGLVLASEAFGCGIAAAVDAPAAGTVTPAAVVACSSLVVSLGTFKVNCGN